MDDARLWIFGYGSLMWNPGFDHDETGIARLTGYARSFCMRSIHHRGTVTQPGLVLALEPAVGKTCDGLALRVAKGAEEETRAYLRARELISSAYLERELDIKLHDSRTVRALTFVIDVDHEQYCAGMPLTEQASIIASAAGGRGPNDEYLYNTASHLKTLGITDPALDWLSERVKKSTVGTSDNTA